MDFPSILWNDPADRELVSQTVELFHDTPLILTDRLTNSVFVNEAAATLFGDRGEALVNRTAYSLLGFGASEKLPEPLEHALLGDSPPWRGIVRISRVDGGALMPQAFCEASAVSRAGNLVCGILRLTPSAPPVAS